MELAIQAHTARDSLQVQLRDCRKELDALKQTSTEGRKRANKGKVKGMGKSNYASQPIVNDL